MSTPTPTRLVYLGRACTSKGQIRHLWTPAAEPTDQAEAWWFKKPLTPAPILGHAYLAEVTQHEGGGVTVHHSTPMTHEGQAVPEEVRRTLWALDRAATQERESHLVASRLSKETPQELEEALDTLAAVYRSLTRYQAKAAFLGWLRGELVKRARLEVAR